MLFRICYMGREWIKRVKILTILGIILLVIPSNLSFAIITSPTSTAAIHDNSGGFSKLSNASGIDTVVIGSSTYAVVASYGEDGVQIIDITNPSSPVAVADIFDGVGGFTALSGANDVSTVVIGSSTYAVVASYFGGVQIIDITTPSSPTAVAAVTDGVGGFTELAGAWGIDTVVIGSSTYAVVTALDDNGVQIIDITTPSSPTATAAVTDGVGGFTVLFGAWGIDTVVIGSSTYAVVTGFFDDGVEIIDITNPSSPTSVAAITDGVGGFTELDGPSSIDTVVIGSSTYAVVAAETDDGVQIIDITTPSSPTATAAVTDGVGGFTELDGAENIDTVVIGSSTYAVVAAVVDDGVQIIDITTPSSPTATAAVTDGVGGFTALAGAWGIDTIVIGSSTYTVVTGYDDNGVQIIDITTPTSPTATAAVFDDTFLEIDELDGAADVATAVIGGSTYAIVPAFDDDGVQIIDITTPTSPTGVASITDGVGGFTELDGAHAVQTVVIGSSTYAVVASSLDDGIQIIDISNPSSPVATAAITDGVGGFTELLGVENIAIVTIGSSTYVLAASFSDDGLQIIDITTPGTPTATAAVTDGVGGFTELLGATGVATAVIGSSTYAIVTGSSDDGVEIIDITTPGTPTSVAAITDGVGGFTELSGAFDVATAVISGSTYAVVSAAGDDGVQIIDITMPGTPTATSAVTDGVGGFTELLGPHGITTVVIGSSTYAIVAGLGDDGVQIIDITMPGTPTATAAVTDGVGGFTELDGAHYLNTVVIGSSTYAIVAAVIDDGVEIILLDGPKNIEEGESESSTVSVGGTAEFGFSETEGTTTDDVLLDVTLPAGTAGTITVETAIEDNLESGVDLATAADITGPCTNTCTISFTVPNTILSAVGLTPDTASIYHDTNGNELLQANEAIATSRDTTTAPGSTIFTGSASFTSKFAVGGVVSVTSANAVAGISALGGAFGLLDKKCDADGFAPGQSLRLYEISHNLCEDNSLEVQAYSTCGPVTVESATDYERKHLGIRHDQPFINEKEKDDRKIVFNGDLDSDIDAFSIIVKDKRDEISERIFVNQCNSTKSFVHATSYTSEQQGSFSNLNPKPAMIPDEYKDRTLSWTNYFSDDEQFFKLVDYLRDNGYLEVKDWQRSSTLKDVQHVPDWFMETAHWWATEEITDEEYVASIWYLVENRILRVTILEN